MDLKTLVRMNVNHSTGLRNKEVGPLAGFRSNLNRKAAGGNARPAAIRKQGKGKRKGQRDAAMQEHSEGWKRRIRLEEEGYSPFCHPSILPAKIGTDRTYPQLGRYLTYTVDTGREVHEILVSSQWMSCREIAGRLLSPPVFVATAPGPLVSWARLWSPSFSVVSCKFLQQSVPPRRVPPNRICRRTGAPPKRRGHSAARVSQRDWQMWVAWQVGYQCVWKLEAQPSRAPRIMFQPIIVDDAFLAFRPRGELRDAAKPLAYPIGALLCGVCKDWLRTQQTSRCRSCSSFGCQSAVCSLQ